MLFTSQRELVPILLTGEHKSRRERLLISNRLNVANLSREIKVSFDHSTNTYFYLASDDLKNSNSKEKVKEILRFGIYRKSLLISAYF